MKGLSFNGELMKAWLAGNKAVTRRPMRPQPYFQPSGACGYPTPASHGNKKWRHYASEKHFRRGIAQDFAPYLPGETVYIKETYWKWGKWVKNGLTRSGTQAWKFTPVPTFAKSVSFEQHEKIPRTETGWHKRLALFMPACDARSLARTVSVRPERVQEITEEEARLEGVTPFRPEGDCWTDGKYRTAFEYLWNELYGWCPNSFESNQWVWRTELEKL